MMHKAALAVLGIVLGIGLFLIAPAARADETNQASRLDLSQPVQIPGGTVLPAGTYWFMVVDEPGVTSNMVRICNADRTIVYATLATVPAERSDITDRTELILAEQPQGKPMALLTWFYPNRALGHEFVYSPSREAELLASERIDVMAQRAS
jgi:hypothetical protein